MIANPTQPGALSERAEVVAAVIDGLCLRTLNGFARESRQDGESLKDAFDRYEIDYAWHVLGADRTRAAVLAALELALRQPVGADQQACVADILQSAAAVQPDDLLMSFDNDLPGQLASLLLPWFARQALPAAAMR